MEELEAIHPDYQKGFNEGYSIAELAPEIAEILIKMQGTSERIEGFKDGHAQFVLEQNKGLLPNWLKSDRLSSINDKAEKGKEKNDLDKE